MMCQRIGDPPISTIGFGLIWVSSASLVPCPPARIATFMAEPFSVGDATSTPHRLISGQPVWRLKFGFDHGELGRKVPRYFCGCSSLKGRFTLRISELRPS